MKFFISFGIFVIEKPRKYSESDESDFIYIAHTEIDVLIKNYKKIDI